MLLALLVDGFFCVAGKMMKKHFFADILFLIL
jgi:hypothetical protein